MYIQIAEELFTSPGDSDDVLSICSCLDTSTSFNEKCSPQSLAQVLLLLLKTLPEPVVCIYECSGICSTVVAMIEKLRSVYHCKIHCKIHIGSSCSSCYPFLTVMLWYTCRMFIAKKQVTVEAIACVETAIAQGSSTAWQQLFLEALPPIHQNIFLYLTAFFRYVVSLLFIQLAYSKHS